MVIEFVKRKIAERGQRKKDEDRRRQIFQESKKALEITRGVYEREESDVAAGKQPWGVYETDASAYLSDFAARFPEVRELPLRLKEMATKYKGIGGLDLCGIANTNTIGTTYSVGLTLKKWPQLVEVRGQRIVEGDIFQSGTRQALLEEIGKQKAPIGIIFFRPVAGLDHYAHQLHAQLKAYEMLRQLWPRVAVGGEVYIETILEGVANLPDVLNSQSTKPFAFRSEYHFNNYYVKITKTEHAPAELRTLDELSQDPALRNVLEKLDDKK